MYCILLKDDSLLRILRFPGYFETPLFRTFFPFPLGLRNSGVRLYLRGVVGPYWNSIPDNIRNSVTAEIFKTRLKSFLLKEAYNSFN